MERFSVQNKQQKKKKKKNSNGFVYLRPYFTLLLTHISLASFLWDISKQHSPRCDAAERGVPSGAILIAHRNFIENKLTPLKMKKDSPGESIRQICVNVNFFDI